MKYNTYNKNVARRQASRSEAGFTVLELMISTAVFSVVLLLCATAIVQVGRMYYKTTLVVRTMDTARAVSDDISQSIQFGTSGTGFFGQRSQSIGGITMDTYCLGTTRYTYVKASRSLGPNTTQQLPHILWKDRLGNGQSSCDAANLWQAVPSVGGQELLGKDMRLSTFDIVPSLLLDGVTPDPSGIWAIKATIAYGATNDLFRDTPTNTLCIDSALGGQFCAVSTISTNAIKRL